MCFVTVIVFILHHSLTSNASHTTQCRLAPVLMDAVKVLPWLVSIATGFYNKRPWQTCVLPCIIQSDVNQTELKSETGTKSDRQSDSGSQILITFESQTPIWHSSMFFHSSRFTYSGIFQICVLSYLDYRVWPQLQHPVRFSSCVVINSRKRKDSAERMKCIRIVYIMSKYCGVLKDT